VVLLLKIRPKAPDANTSAKILQVKRIDLARIDGLRFLVDLRFEALIAQVKLPQIRQPFGITLGNFIQCLLHTRRELDIDQIREMRFEQAIDRKRREGRDKLVAALDDVAAILDCTD